MDLMTCRIVITQEIDQDKNLNGTMVKQFASGGDKISARKNYVNEQTFNIQATLFMCCNDLP